MVEEIFGMRGAFRDRKHEFRESLVKKGATIGANATIICGIIIERYAFIGAGAVVTKNVPAYALVLGNPAKLSGWMCICGNRLEFEAENGFCAHCSKRYYKEKDKVRLRDEG